MTQKEQIRNYLESGNKITGLEALHLFDCMRLADVVYKLKKDGLTIETKMIKTITKKWVAQYWIKKEEGWSEWKNIKYF